MASPGPAAPVAPVTCQGFYPTNRNVQSQGSHVTSGSAKACNQTVGGETFGWCSCSDSVPRIVNQGSRRTTCDWMCANTPSAYTSDIPALTGTPASKSLSNFNTLRLEKLAGAMAAFLVGCGLLVFHVMDRRTIRIGGEKSLVELVKATQIAPNAR